MVRKIVDLYFATIKSSFANALEAAVRKGELGSDFKTENWSSSLATLLIGMFVTIRSRADGSALRAAANLAISQLADQRPPPKSGG